jgi:parallel beta-helix repeat protein
MNAFKIGMAGVLAIALTIAAARIAAAGGPTGWGYPSCLPVTAFHVNTAYGGGTTTGIYLAGGLNFTIVNNRINEADFGIYGGNGNWGKFRDNVTTAVGVPFTGGTNLGNNN